MLSDKTWLLFYGTIVTTHRIEAYGGTRFPRGFLNQLATQINDRGLPLSQNHDPSKRLRASDFRATVVEREDGEFSLDFEAKVHPDDAQVLAKTPGLSITLTTPLDGEKDTGE